MKTEQKGIFLVAMKMVLGNEESKKGHPHKDVLSHFSDRLSSSYKNV